MISCEFRIYIVIFLINIINQVLPSNDCYTYHSSVQFSCSIMSDSVIPWIAALQPFLSITNSQSLLRLMSIKLVMPSNLLILCHPLLLLLSIFPCITVFSNESVLHIRWLKYWSFSFSINPSNGYLGLISFRIDWFDHLSHKVIKIVLKMS